MDDNELQELQDPKNWDYKNAEVHPGNKNRRAVVSVAFARQDFERLVDYAERHGVTVSGLIRDTVLRRIENMGAPGIPSQIDASSAFTTHVSQEIPTQAGWSDKSGYISKQTTKTLASGTHTLQRA
jgi:hypothetical protein